MVLGMENTARNRALWAVALHELADAIQHGVTDVPDNILVHQHGLTIDQLISRADFTVPGRALKVYPLENGASVRVPTGEPLGLQIELVAFWQKSNDEDANTRAYELIAMHNNACVPIDLIPAEPDAQHGQMDDLTADA